MASGDQNRGGGSPEFLDLALHASDLHAVVFYGKLAERSIQSDGLKALGWPEVMVTTAEAAAGARSWWGRGYVARKSVGGEGK